jgi:hypothetical protein
MVKTAGDARANQRAAQRRAKLGGDGATQGGEVAVECPAVRYRDCRGGMVGDGGRDEILAGSPPAVDGRLVDSGSPGALAASPETADVGASG